MRNLLLIIVIVCAIIATLELADGQTSTTGNLETVETSTSVFDYQDWYEETNKLEGRVHGVHGNLNVSGQRERRSTRYSGLAPQRNTSPYKRIIGEIYESLTLRQVGPKEIIVEAGNSTPISKKIRLAPVTQPPEHGCECTQGRGICRCPPLVCQGDYCDTNYAIVFTSKTCPVCPQMWPVIKKLREDGYVVFYVETDKHPGILERLGIQVWPTTLVMKNKQLKVRFWGVTTAEKIAEHLKTRKQQGLTTNRGKP